jgi:phage head maturation protease
VAQSARSVADLVEAGDLDAARAAFRVLASLFGADRTEGPVVDLETERAKRGR